MREIMNYKTAALIAALLLIFWHAIPLPASESFTNINVAAAKTPVELRVMIEQLNAGSAEAVKSNAFNYEVQSAVLAKAGECIDKAVSLHKGMEELERSVLLANREVIRRIVDLNKKVLDDTQEKLDDMENPLGFFKTPAWQQPEQLLVMASFRLGWNDYYAGLLFPEKDVTGKQMFTEAVESFSRAFASSKEDKMLITSLFGRALSYRRLQLFKEALKDFKSVKVAIKKDDPMYLRCCYEETVIASLTGKSADVLRNIDQIEKNYPATRIPAELKTSLQGLKESALHAMEDKAAKDSGALPTPAKDGP
jgi:hypothetical protein